MNNLCKIASRVMSLNQANAFKNTFVKRDFARNIWYMTNKNQQNKANGGAHIKVLGIETPSLGCSCGCGSKFVHTKCERELVEFLTEEILAERKSQKGKTVMNSLDDFAVTYDGADVTLSKKLDNEKIEIHLNVNHTVDSEDDETEINAKSEKDVVAMRSKPQFEVDVVKGSTTLSFTCSFLEGVADAGEYDDIFGIDEFCIYENEWNDKVYAVAGDVLDGYLYDLLMNLLEEKGISNEFAEKLSELATIYEHSSYISLLEKLSKFTVGK